MVALPSALAAVLPSALAATPVTAAQTAPTATSAGGGTATPAPVAGNEVPSWVPSQFDGVIRNTPPWLVDLALTVVVIGAAYLVSRLLVQLLGRRIARRFRRPSLTRTALRGIRVSVFIVALLTVLGIYGYRLSDIALSVTIFSAVVGVILAPIVGSVISGVFLLADQPYEIGDMIELADRGQRGFVEDITLRYTKMFTLDNSFLVIPNGSMRDRDVVNYSAEDTRTRQALDVLVTYESDVDRARTLIEEAARGVDGIIPGGPRIRVGAARYPAGPTCYIDTFADSGINLRLRYWVEKPYWLLTNRSRIQTAIWEAFEGEDVEMAYPHQHVVFDETSGEMQVSMSEGGPRPSGDRPADARPPTGPDVRADHQPNGDGKETPTDSPGPEPPREREATEDPDAARADRPDDPARDRPDEDAVAGGDPGVGSNPTTREE